MAPLRRHSTAAAVAAVVTALAVGLIAASALHAGAQPAPGPQGRQPGAAPAGEASTELRVAVKPIEPFVVATDDGWAGFSIDLWESLADRLGASFDYVEVDSVQGQLDAVAGGDADVAVAAISITSEREEAVDFSQPMYESGLQVLVPAGGGFRPGASSSVRSTPA